MSDELPNNDLRRIAEGAQEIADQLAEYAKPINLSEPVNQRLIIPHGDLYEIPDFQKLPKHVQPALYSQTVDGGKLFAKIRTRTDFHKAYADFKRLGITGKAKGS